MRYQLTDFEWTAVGPFLSNKRRGVPRVNGRGAPYFAWGCFRDFCPGPAMHRRSDAMPGPGDEIVHRAYRTNRSNCNTSRSNLIPWPTLLGECDQFRSILEMQAVEMIPSAAPDEAVAFKNLDDWLRNLIAPGNRAVGAFRP
jgi:hypothetical protein